MLTLRSKDVFQLNHQEYTRCRRLSFGENGQMAPDLFSYFTKPDVPAKVVLLEDEKQLIGWALIGEDLFQEVTGNVAMFYVRAKFRNKGYGSLLMKEVLEIDKNPYVFPHDRRSGGFFKKTRTTIRFSEHDSGWLDD